MIYFHYCNSYLREVTAPVDKTIRRKLHEYSYRDNLKGINPVAGYTAGMYVLNLVNPHYKVILQEHRITIHDEELSVYFVRFIYAMGQKTLWLQNYVQIRDGKWLDFNKLEDQEIESFKSAFILSQNIEEKAFPPNSLTSWHNNYRLKVDYDIYEADSWVKFAMSNSHSDGMKDDEAKVYRLLLLSIIDSVNSSMKTDILYEDEANSYEIIAAQQGDIGIIYSMLLSDEKNGFTFLLHNGANIKTQSDHWRDAQAKILIEPVYNSLEAIQRVAVRAYPKWALNEPDLWKAIEKNSETGNLSLLPEQTIFLKEFTFPKYINGQAGSGKSTMLYYLFSNAYFYKCFGEIKGDIIFLTENEELLKHTKKSVVELLQSNPEFTISAEDIVNVDNHFSSFRRFLLSLVPDGKELFDVEKYLDFPTFKSLYEKSAIPTHIIRRYSAELVWFAISTYIYGYDLNFQITSENYDEILPSDSKTLLLIDDLKGIEKEVLPFYRKLLDTGYWDKIKIIRYIKSKLSDLKQYEVIFCDEAQDFSRVELQFILGLSQYINYDLSETLQVPIVFAGDALQTVNPTGFRSAEVKDMLYRELKQIASFNLMTDNIEYAPGYNYRSSQSIVNVANAIQYYRKIHFKADIKSPQIAKRPDFSIDNNLNVFLDRNNVSDDVKLKLKYKTFIIPTNSDEKEVYIQNHPFLEEFRDNIKTAVEAKGIDYDQVVLYGFGEYIREKNNIEEYEHRFFYNKIYVAVTRAQHELIIIDSKESQTEFWLPLINNYADSQWSRLSEIEEDIIRKTIVFGAGQITIIQSTPELAYENAMKDKNQGLFDRNPFLLRVAASQFIRLGYKSEHYKCLGFMYKVEKNWIEAAKHFLKKEVGPEGVTEAADIYWEGKLLVEFLSTASLIKTSDKEVQKLIAKLLVNKELNIIDLRVLFNYRSDLRKLLSEIIWREEVINEFISLLNKEDEEQAKLVIDILEEIGQENDKLLWLNVGERNFKLQRYEFAIDSFEKISYDGPTFIEAHIRVAERQNNFGELIIWYGRKAKASDNIDQISSIESEIINIFNKFEKAINIHGYITSFQLVYSAILIHIPNSLKLISISQSVEKELRNLNRTAELVSFYEDVLKDARVNPMVVDFVFSRWIKNMNRLNVNLDDINNRYKFICNKLSINSTTLTREYITQISEYPDKILPDAPSHISSVLISNFRRFESINIDNLSLVNLIVGDNNVGKTTILESLLFTQNKEDFLLRLAISYIQRRNLQPEKNETSESTHIYYKIDEKFLNDFKNYTSDHFEIRYTITENTKLWNFKISTTEIQKNLYSDDFFQPIFFNEDDLSKLKNIDFYDCIMQPFMPYGQGYGIDLAKVYYTQIGVKPSLEDEFIENMRTFIPTIQRIKCDTVSGNIDILDNQFQDEYRPLHHYGEGANKLFRILLLLVLHKGKRVLIDEIDAGIHYTRFKNFWRGILKIVVKDKTQLIVTTHNEECIKYFSEILEELGATYQELARVVQLKNVADSIKIRSYDFHNFHAAIQQDLELRGGVKNG